LTTVKSWATISGDYLSAKVSSVDWTFIYSWLKIDQMNLADWIAVTLYGEWILYYGMTGLVLLWTSLHEQVTNFWIYLYSGTAPIYIGQYRSPGWGEISRVLIAYSLNMLTSVGFAIAVLLIILGGTTRDLYIFAFVPFAFQFSNFFAIDRVGHLNNIFARIQTPLISIGLIFAGLSTYYHQGL
jgi:hypothetical protein